MRNTKRVLSMLVALILALGCMGGMAVAEGTKYTVETTADGWIKVVNEGGATLGYSPDSGVTIIEDDGFAFKDLDKDGELDIYEDWRLSAEERAADLAERLDYKYISSLMFHGDVQNMEMDGSNATMAQLPLGVVAEYDPADGDMTNTVLPKGMRTFISRLGAMPAVNQAKLNNNLQTVAETLDYGIPLMFTTDPRAAYSDSATNLAMAATFDPELINLVYSDLADIYRAIGISEVLGPQIDLTTEPRWRRFNGTFGEDPALARDMAKAAIGGFQSTYDEDGNDLGWGERSVVAVMKHWPNDGAGESGREAHSPAGKYNVYPGNAFGTGMIPFVDGGLNLDSATETVGTVMSSYSIAYTNDESLGELVGSAFSEYKIQLLRSYGFDGLICTDSGVVDFPGANHGVEDLDGIERVRKIVDAGVDQIMGYRDIKPLLEQVYEQLADEIGEDAALARYRESARRILRGHFQVGLFENAYVDTAFAAEAVETNVKKGHLDELAEKSIIMLKNSDETIRAAGDTKPMVYIPMKYQAATAFTAATFALPVNEKIADTYFNVVTDTLGEPTGEPDADGNPTYSPADVIRASAEEVAECDYALVFVANPSTGIGFDANEGYIPISLQYGEYTAKGAAVRSESIAGDVVETTAETPYGTVQASEKEDRSYYGKSTVASNLSDLELILETAAKMPESAKVIVSVTATNPMIFSEFESEVDAILVNLGVKNDAVAKIVAGEVEPSGLLPFQMPANMETVEAQFEDVPRDMECYVDANGNTYDFAFGLNWSGVINDERVATYAVPALTEPALQPIAD